MMHREPNYWPDVASEIDSPEEMLADELGIDLETATKVQRWHEAVVEAEAAQQKNSQMAFMLGFLLDGVAAKGVASHKTIMARLHALAFAAGLHELNGLHSQSESARQIGVSRALISHYVTTCAELLHISNYSYRKSETSRSTFKKKTEAAWQPGGARRHPLKKKKHHS